MEHEIFETIANFCNAKNYPLIYNRILLHKFYEDYKKVINDHTIKEGSDPTNDTLKGFKSTLLNDMTLTSNIKLAEDELKNYSKEEINKFERKQSTRAFWISVLSGVIASIIYTLLLIIFFYLGKNQLSSWLNDLNSNTSQETKKIE
ncbi:MULTISPECIES: hypothetical protein [Chryseobacterium]|uniref:hypothetical protein n=1 Tax=Chryseobacterium TaxID=59732 RepID=UPI000E0B307C|nr:hypothetical protein [Chryseobacterium sp. KLBC 52]